MSTELDKLYYTVDADTGPYKAKMADVGAVSESAGKKIASTFKEADTAVRATHGSASMATREFRALFDEVSSGRTRMVPGTLAIIATRVFGISGATLGLAAAIAAVPIAFGVAAYQVEAALARMDRALGRTGFASGANRSDILGIANNLNDTTGLSERGAVDTLSILASRGNVPLSQMRGAAQASYVYGQQTGLSEDKAAEAFEKILAEPKKGAEELYATFKNLTNAQQKQIEQDIAVGNSEGARQIIIDAEIASQKDLIKSTGSLGSFFDGLGKKLSNFWWNTGSTFVDSRTDQQKMTDLNAARADWSTQGIFGGDNSKKIADIDRQRGALHYKMRTDAARDQAAQQHNVADAIDRQMQALIDKADVATTTTKNYNDAIALANKDLAGLKPGSAQYNEVVRVRNAYQEALRTHKTPEEILAYKIPKPKGEGALRHDEDYAAEAAGQQKIVEAYRESTQAGQLAEFQLEAENKLRDKAITSTKDYVAAKMAEAGAKKEIAQIEENRRGQDEISVLQLEISLMGTDETLRKKRIADLQVENDLKEKGISLTSAEGQAALAVAEKKIDLGKTLSDGQEQQQNDLSVAKEGVTALGTIFDHANQGAKGLRTLLPDLTQQLLQMIEKLAILNPLENALTGAVTGTPGKLPTMANAPGMKKVGTGIGRFIGHMFGGDSGATAAMASGPNGHMGISAASAAGSAAIHAVQQISIHPDVSAVARGTVMSMMPQIHASALQALSSAIARGFVPGAIGA